MVFRGLLRRIHALTLLFGLSIVATPAFAEELFDEEEQIKATLSSVVVTASGFEQDIDDAPASISIITREQLESRPFNNLADAVRGITGVNYVGSDGNSKDITIRGLPGEYTLIMVDGKRQGTRETRQNGNGGYEAGFIPPLEAIERIEIIRGPMSTLYGSDAMGGVINIITRKSSDRWRASLGLDHTYQEDRRSGDTTNGNFWLNGPLIQDKLALQITGSANLREEDRIIDGYNENSTKTIAGKFIFTPIERQEFSLDLGRTTQRHDNTAGKSSTSTGYTETNRNNIGFTYNGDFDLAKPYLSAYYEEAKALKSGQTPEIKNTVVDGHVTIPLPMNMLMLGGQYQLSKLNASSVIGTGSGTSYTAYTDMEAYQYAFFIEDEFQLLDNLSLVGGIRMDDHEHFGDHWSPRGYIVYHPIRNWTVKGGVAKGFKTPSLRQLDPNFGYATARGAAVMYGDPDLKPEESTNYEASVTYRHPLGYSASVTAFQTDFKNKITNYALLDGSGNNVVDPSSGKNIYVYENIGKARIRGIETGITVPLPAALELSANYTYMKSERRTDEDGAQGEPLSMAPKHAYNVRLDWQALENLNFYALVEYTGTQVSISNHGGAGKLSTITTLDLGGTYRVNENTRINFAVLNVTDDWIDNPSEYSGDSLGVIGEGRRYWVGIVVDF